MSVAHSFPSQKHSRNLNGFLKAMGFTIAGVCMVVLMQPLVVSAETDHQPKSQPAQVEQITEPSSEARAQPARKPVRVIQIWNIPAQENSQN